MFLTASELAELTGRHRSDAQRRALEALGVPFKTRHDGTVVVLRSAAEAALGHAPTQAQSRSPRLRLPAA